MLNPYYQHMGGLYGSEYWTYLLPRRVGAETAAELTSAPFRAIGTRRAVEIGLIDERLRRRRGELPGPGRRTRRRLARHPDHAHWLEEKRRARARDEQAKPLSVYRTEELARSHECFFGADRSYHEARTRFVYKTRRAVRGDRRARAGRARASAVVRWPTRRNERLNAKFRAHLPIDRAMTDMDAGTYERARAEQWAAHTPSRLARHVGEHPPVDAARADASRAHPAPPAPHDRLADVAARRRPDGLRPLPRPDGPAHDPRGRRARLPGAAGDDRVAPAADAGRRRVVRPDHRLGDARPPVGRRDRGALPLLRDDRRAHALPGLDAVPDRDRLRRRAPRRHGRARAQPGLRPPGRGRESLALGADPRLVRARRERGAHRRLAHEREPAAARPAHGPAEPAAVQQPR